MKLEIDISEHEWEYLNKLVANGDQLGHYERLLVNGRSKTEWIPVNEKMPEVTGYYLIQYSRAICRDEMAVAYYSVEEKESDSNYEWEFKPCCGEYKEVVAWRPLPKPHSEVDLVKSLVKSIPLDKVKQAKEEISKSCYKACITDDGVIRESKVLEILDRLMESEEK